jgi:hypothetical protein
MLERDRPMTDDSQQWMDLARETVRNLSRLVEDAQAILRQAEDRLRRLEDEAENSD